MVDGTMKCTEIDAGRRDLRERLGTLRRCIPTSVVMMSGTDKGSLGEKKCASLGCNVNGLIGNSALFVSSLSELDEGGRRVGTRLGCFGSMNIEIGMLSLPAAVVSVPRNRR